jgi:hypothetical protein
MTKSPTTTSSASATPEATKLILLDYHGTVGSAPRQRDVAHTRSPLVLNLYENGVPDLFIQPGLNLVDGATFETYNKRDKGTQEMVKRKQLKVLKALPEEEDDLIKLIERTISRAALDHIQAYAEQRTSDDPDRRQALLDAIAVQRSTTTAIEPESRNYVPAAGINVEQTIRSNDIVQALADMLRNQNQSAASAHA